jgi:3-oxoacyl-[acyl-carrier protein] reductase
MKYEEIIIGDKAEITHVVTPADLDRFVELTGDDNKLHTDASYAANTHFKKPVVHGMLGASFISTIIGTKIPGDGALWFSQSLEFLLPVRINDTIRVVAEVIKKDDRNHIIEIKTDIYNQNKQVVIQGVAKVKVIEQQVNTDEEVVTHNKKVALVIGGSGGIGAAVCEVLATDGFEVIVHYFNNKTTAQKIVDKILQKGQKASACQCDIADEHAVNEMALQILRKHGAITALVNCSTTRIAPVKFAELAWSDFEAHFNNQIKGSFNLVKAIVPEMEKKRYGKIIHIDTQYVDAPESHLMPYISAKSALRGFTKSLAYDLAPKGIRVNSVSPGMTDTEQISDIPERMRLVLTAKTPLRRLATPMDVANAVSFLASDKSDYLSGETIRVNGGQVML